MVIFFAFLFSFSFAQYAQEAPSWLVNQDYYDLKCYPTDAHTKITFEQAQRRLAQNSHDQQAFVALNNLVFRQNPYIPAVRLLAGQALRNGDFDRGFALVSMGQAAGDLPCIYSKASLLLNAQQVPCLAYADPYMAECEAQQLLQYAAGTVDFSTPGKIKKYYITGAVKDLEQIKAESNYRLWTAFEKSLDRMPASMRQTFADTARAQRLFHESCYCIKKLLPENPDSALEWSAELIGAPDFNYDQFMSNGTYQALQTLANDTNHPAHAKAAFLLGYLDYARLGEGQSVDLSALERNLTAGADHDIRALLMLASYADTKEDLKLYADQIVHRLDEIDARLYGTVAPDIIQLYYAIMKSGQTKFANGLVKLLKHDAFKTTRDELAKDPQLAAQVGMQLLEIRDQLTIDAASKGRADYRKIHDAGLALTKAAADSLHDGASWALVAHSLHPFATESQKNKLDEHVAQAMMSTQARLERGMPLLSAASDVMRTLEKLQTTASLSQESCHALAHWYINGVPGLLARDELKAIEYLSRVDNFVVPLQEAFEQGKINDPRACLRAGILMHQKSALIGTRNQLFVQAITHGSLAEKKQAALYCVEHKDLIGHACSALTVLFEEHERLSLSDEAQAAQLREQVLTPVLNTLLGWAVGSHKSPQGDAYGCHPDAIMFFYRSPFISELTIQDKEKIDRLVEWAAFAGHKQAVDVLEPTFRTIEKDTMAIIKAVDYWQSWLNLYEQDPQKKEQVDQAYSYLKILSDWVLELHEKNNLPVLAINTYYQLGQIFMDRDPIRAVNHILLIEEIVKRTGNNLPKAAQQIASVGLYDILEKKAREGVDWACYVLAHVHINRLKILTDQNVENHKLCFERIDTIKELFEKSKTFDTTRLDPRLRTLHRAQKGRPALTLAEIEYHEAEMARVLNQLSNRPDPATFERWLKMLHASADKFFPEAMFSLAELILDGELHRGQDALERAVYLLCAAAETGLKDAQDSLADVARQGLALRAPCGGNMTESLHSQIQQSLQKIGLTPAVQPIVSDQNVPSTEFERALSD